MQQPQHLRNKLKAYSALAGTLAASGAGAQVVYTDINPDTIITQADTVPYALDMNNDGITDFRFLVFGQTSSSSFYNAAFVTFSNAQNAIRGSIFYSNYAFPSTLANGDSIKPANTDWRGYNFYSGQQFLGLTYSSGQYGNWPNGQDHYLGVRFADNNNQLHYGWVRLRVNGNSDTIIVREYAYETQPNVGIAAGVVAGVHDLNTLPVHVHAYDKTVFVDLGNTAVPNSGRVRILDLTGRVVREEEITGTAMRIEAPFETGVYLVEVTAGDKRSCKKVYLR